MLHAKDDLTREFLNLYGLHITGTGKMAQQSIKEITGSNNAALVIPYEMMKARNDTLERFNAITGLNVVCKLAKSWEREDAEAAETVEAINPGEIYQLQPDEQPLLTDNEGQEEAPDEPTDTTETTPDEVHEGEVTEPETVAEEIAEQAEDGLTVEAQANTLPINEDGRREIPDEYNDTASIQDESDTTDPS